MKNVNKRWQIAQDYEKDWWVSKANQLDLEFYERFARNVEAAVAPYIALSSDKYILEIGSGAAGIITFINCNNRYAIDPLENTYASIEKFASARDKSVKYQEAKAEELPFADNMFDFIIIDNVLDHCENPIKVLSEMNRVLKNNGIIYFRQNTYHLWGKIIRKAIEFFKIDKGHPHTFLKSELKNLFLKNKMEILLFDESGYFKTWLKEIKSSRFYDKMKALIFATRDKTTFVLMKKNKLFGHTSKM
ncbi:MAG: class I SAM-dependent methyltransferase [Methylococcales bacterium]|nr:class I SAM-dependent methyltransferase [Methylococcales bacterium]